MCGTAKMVVNNSGKMVCLDSTPPPPTPSTPTDLGLVVRYVRITKGAPQNLLGLCFMTAYAGRGSHTHFRCHKCVCGSKNASRLQES